MKYYIEVIDGIPTGNLHAEFSLPHVSPELRARLVEVVRRPKPQPTPTHVSQLDPVFVLESDGLVYETWPMRPWTEAERRLAPVPTSVGSGQIRAAMIATGIAADDDALTTIVEGILAGIPDPTQRAIAVTLWRNASEFRRDHQFIAVVQAALGKTSAQIDDLFRLAATF